MEKLTFEQLPEAVSQIFEKLEQIKFMLKEQQTPLAPEEDKLLTIKEASEFLRLSVPTLYGYVQRSGIPYSKGAKRLYFSKAELGEWIKSGRRRTTQEIIKDNQKYLGSKRP